MFCDSDKCCFSKQKSLCKKEQACNRTPRQHWDWPGITLCNSCLSETLKKNKQYFLVTHFCYEQLFFPGLFPMKSRAEPLAAAYATQDQQVVDVVKENPSSCFVMNFLNSWLQEIWKAELMTLRPCLALATQHEGSIIKVTMGYLTSLTSRKSGKVNQNCCGY